MLIEIRQAARVIHAPPEVDTPVDAAASLNVAGDLFHRAPVGLEILATIELSSAISFFL